MRNQSTMFVKALFVCSLAFLSALEDFDSLKEFIPRQKRAVSETDKIRADVELLARQLMMTQFYVEEQTRTSGSSGLKRIRLNKQGSRPYQTPTYGDQNFAALHNHANYADTLGLGELVVVLNGVEFRTRHLDYKLKMKSKTSDQYGRMDLIPFPDVPPAVLALKDPSAQVAEMREWFRAFRDQDYKIRDYRPYFKPVLCYIEGTWTNSDQNSIEESFESDRHHLDATSWLDMQEKTRFTAYTGAKDILENYAYLPTTVMGVGNNGSVSIAQWNFRLGCHPLSRDVPTSRLFPIDDIKTRVSERLTWDAYVNSRAARYRVSPIDKSKATDMAYRRGFLDELMEEVPGMDNYPAQLQDDALGDEAFPFNTIDYKPLNVGYYNRWYRSKEPGAMGLTSRHRSFADENVFMAMNTQDHLAGVHVERCTDVKDPNTCKEWKQKWSYALPLEIVYITPLTNWNPYGILNKGISNSEKGRTVTAGGRNGLSPEKAFDGINDQLFYQTPTELFGTEVGSDPADTILPSVYVLDIKGSPRAVSASGHRVLMNIDGVGLIRQRYPIIPLYEEGDTVWKHLEALMEIILNPQAYQDILRNPIAGCSGCSDGTLSEKSGTSTSAEASSSVTTSVPSTTVSLDQQRFAKLINKTTDVVFKVLAGSSSHVHFFALSKEAYDSMIQGARPQAITDEANGHKHDISLLSINRVDAVGNPIYLYNINKCDGQKDCPGGHERRLEMVYPS